MVLWVTKDNTYVIFRMMVMEGQQEEHTGSSLFPFICLDLILRYLRCQRTRVGGGEGIPLVA